LQAVRNYILAGGKSRGTYVVSGGPAEENDARKKPENEDGPDDPPDFNGLISLIKIKNAHTLEIDFTLSKVNPIPPGRGAAENLNEGEAGEV
jgi:hypothetical protein